MLSTKIAKVTAFQTPDGKIHKTELDASIHLGGLEARLAHLCEHIKTFSEYQRKAKKIIAHEYSQDKDWNRELRIRDLQTSIAERGNMLAKWFKERNEIAKHFRTCNGLPPNHFTKGM